MYQPSFRIISVVLIFSINIESSHGTRATFGELCDNSVRCDSLAFLTCQNNSCICLKPNAMTFDHNQEICVALAGEKCKFTVVEDYRSWLEEVNCVQNSKCVTPQNVCICETGFSEISDGSCVPKRSFAQICNATGDCLIDLKCIDGQCKCDPEQSIYDYEHRQCVGLADKPCLNDLCTANALCRGYYGGHSADSYEEYSGEDTKCACAPGFTKSHEGLCHVGHGGICDVVDTPCLDKFKCEDGICTCIFQDHQAFQNQYQDCYSLVGGPCTPPRNASSTNHAIHCVKPAICLPQGKFRYECGCPEGMEENAERSCELTHGRICPTERSPSTNGLKCDSLAPLFCIQGKCQCKDEFKIYDSTVKRCRGLVGSNCNISKEQANFCVDGAYCIPNRGSQTMGRCECSKYFVELRNRTCSVGFDSNMIL